MKTRNLFLAIVLTFFIITGATAQTWNIGSPNEGDVTATLTDGKLVISGTGAMKDYAKVNNQPTSPWGNVATQIQEVVIKNGVTSIGNSAFDGCSSLVSATLPNSVKTIGDASFAECSNLASLIIPEGVTSIGSNTFIFSGLVSVTIPNSVKSIGWQAFIDCFDLLSVTIGSGITKIEDFALAECFSLKSVTCLNPDPATILMGPGVFESNDMNNCILHVPVGSIGLYRKALQWQDFYTITDGATTENIPSLANLTVNEGMLSPAFNPNIHAYQVTVPQSVDHITLTATPVSNETVSGAGEKALNTGKNTLEITVSTSLGSVVYTIEVTRLSRSDSMLQFTGYSEITTGNAKVTYFDPVTNSNKTASVIDQYKFEYLLNTGTVSGNLPLHFNIDGYTCDKTLNVNANSIYKITLSISGITYNQYNYDIAFITSYDNYGRPASTTMNYRRHSGNVSASMSSDVLSTEAIDFVGSGFSAISLSNPVFLGGYTSLKELTVMPTATVFPNPATEFITIQDVTAGTVAVSDGSGRTVYQQTITDDNQTINVSSWAKGMYIVTIQTDDKKIVSKIIKK